MSWWHLMYDHHGHVMRRRRKGVSDTLLRINSFFYCKVSHKTPLVAMQKIIFLLHVWSSVTNRAKYCRIRQQIAKRRIANVTPSTLLAVSASICPTNASLHYLFRIMACILKVTLLVRFKFRVIDTAPKTNGRKRWRSLHRWKRDNRVECSSS